MCWYSSLNRISFFKATAFFNRSLRIIILQHKKHQHQFKIKHLNIEYSPFSFHLYTHRTPSQKDSDTPRAPLTSKAQHLALQNSTHSRARGRGKKKANERARAKARDRKSTHIFIASSSSAQMDRLVIESRKRSRASGADKNTCAHRDVTSNAIAASSPLPSPTPLLPLFRSCARVYSL